MLRLLAQLVDRSQLVQLPLKHQVVVSVCTLAHLLQALQALLPCARDLPAAEQEAQYSWRSVLATAAVAAACRLQPARAPLHLVVMRLSRLVMLRAVAPAVRCRCVAVTCVLRPRAAMCVWPQELATLVAMSSWTAAALAAP